MWTEEYKNFRRFAENFRELFLFNTLKENGSLTCYYLQKYGNINPSKTYRKMKNLEEEGFLRSQSEQNKAGRPKINYFLTEKGELKRKEIRFEAERYFRFLQKNQILSLINLKTSNYSIKKITLKKMLRLSLKYIIKLIPIVSPFHSHAWICIISGFERHP